MIRIAVALLIICVATALAVAIPDLRIAVFLLGGIGAVIVAASGKTDQAPRAERSTVQLPALPDQAVVEAIAGPVLLVVDGRVRMANAAALTLLGNHIVGEDIRLAIRHPAAAERLGMNDNDGVTELVGLGGRDQRIQMQVSTIAPGRRLIHLIDHTTSYAAERARVDFVANSSHELRTPLAAIIGFIETLDDENAESDPQVRERFLSVMMKEARRMQRLIDDLISLSRIEAEKYSLPDTAIALAPLIAEVAGELRDTRGESAAEIVLDIHPDVAAVTGDRTQLSQVIHNLAGNAFKYGRPGTPVTIALKPEGQSRLRLSVTDQGDGIAPEHLPRITERFYRVDPARSRSQGGTGLGLAIVKHIVERHRGQLDIASTVGTGTTVSVLLPTAGPPAVTELSSK